MIARTLLLALLIVSGAADAAAQSTIVLVRHAERTDSAGGGQMMMAADPDLSDAGRARAESLASVLRNAGVNAIYATEFKRTQQTAAPLSRAGGIPVTTVPSKDTAALLEKLKASKGTVLVVGHSNTLPGIVKGLGVAEALTIGESEYDNLLVVSTGPAPRLLRLRYR